jgi:hypothetical protein
MHDGGVSLPCPGPCQNLMPPDGICCHACLLLLPCDLVVLAHRSRSAAPALFDTAVRCVEMWFRVRHPSAYQSAS